MNGMRAGILAAALILGATLAACTGPGSTSPGPSGPDVAQPGVDAGPPAPAEAMPDAGRGAGDGGAVNNAAEGDGGQSPPSVVPDPDAPVEVFPHVRIDRAAGLVEFDGIVPIDAHNAEASLVYLEVIACTPDTKEHESLVMSLASASDVHAALLMLGIQPGRPGRFEWNGGRLRGISPTGPTIRVSLAVPPPSGDGAEFPPERWIVSARTGQRFAPGRWVFAGSGFGVQGGREFYLGDAGGTLVGLHTFGTETVALDRVMSPDSSVEEVQWIADPARVPAYGTPVIVRLRVGK